MIFNLLKLGPTWTISSAGGGTAVNFDVFLNMEFKGESAVAAEPVEEGSFASYNKQNSPNEISVTLASTGIYSLQQNVLDTIDKLASGTELVSLATPSAEYKDLNITSYNYRRSDQGGAGMLVVELKLQEIKQVESSARTESTQKGTSVKAESSKQKSNASTQNTGKTQPKKSGGREWKPYNSVLSGKGNS